ncbi:MAG: hypothetical protein ACMXYE_05490 [Candidatus Woesearchaeota archaeon]
MVQTWFTQKGYKRNPLHIEPLFSDDIFGYDLLLEELFEKTHDGSILFLEGNDSKTAILTKIVDKYRGNIRLAYVNCAQMGNEPNIYKLITNGKKTLSVMLKRIPKDMVVLLDNVSSLSTKNAERIKYLFDEGYLRSLIMTARSYRECDIPDSIRHRIGRRLYTLRDLSDDERIDIVLNRLGFPDFINESHLLKLAQKTKTTKELLQECDSLLFFMAGKNKHMMDDAIVSAYLQRRK